MPTVPTYEGPRVRDAGTQPSYQPGLDVSSTSRALAQGLAQAGEAADRVAQRSAETAANNADTEISGAWLQWDAEARRKYQGQNAAEYGVEAKKWWDTKAQEYAQKLDPRARALVSPSLMRKKVGALGAVAQHVNNEQERAADQSADAAISTQVQMGVTNGDLAGAAGQIKTIVAGVGARKGWTTEQVQEAQLKSLGTLHLSNISSLAQRDAAAARKYYEENKAEIPATSQARVNEVLTGEADNQWAQKRAGELAPLPYEEQLAAAAKESDPRRLDKLMQHLKVNQGAKREAQQESERRQSDIAWQLVGKGRAVPEEVLGAMDGKERVQLQDYLRQRAEHMATKAGAPVKTDTATHAALIDMMLNDPEAFKKERIAAHAYKLSQTDLEQMATRQQAMRDPKAGPKQDSMLTDEKRIQGALTNAGIDPKKHPERAYAISLEIDARVRAESTAKGGKDLTADEKQKVIDNVFMDKVFISEWGRDPERPVSTATPDELKGAYVRIGEKDVPVSVVPAADRAEIVRARKARGLPVTEQTIVETYMRAKGK